MNVSVSDTLDAIVDPEQLLLLVLLQDLFDPRHFAQISALADLPIHSRADTDIRLVAQSQSWDGLRRFERAYGDSRGSHCMDGFMTCFDSVHYLRPWAFDVCSCAKVYSIGVQAE